MGINIEAELQYLAEQESECDLSHSKIDMWHDVDRAAAFPCCDNFACDTLEDRQCFRKKRTFSSLIYL